MRQIIVFPRGQLKPADRKRLAEVGAVAVEADDPSKVVTALPLATVGPIVGDDITASMLEALSRYASHSNPSCDFVRILAKRTKEREEQSAIRSTEKGDTR